MIDEEIIWFAGFLDGEGSIGVHKDGHYLRPQITVESTSLDVMDWLGVRFNLKPSLRNSANRLGNKPSKILNIRNRKVLADLLPRLIPYLKIKQQAALKTLDFIKMEK